MNIQYGGDRRKENHVYIHPLKRLISGETHYTNRKSDDLCDSNISLEEIPLFWKDRISSIDVTSIDADVITKAYLKRKIREACCDPRFGYNPMETIYALKPIFYQIHTPNEAKLIVAAKSAWNTKEKIIFHWLKFKYSSNLFNNFSYYFLTYLRLEMPFFWRILKGMKKFIKKSSLQI